MQGVYNIVIRVRLESDISMGEMREIIEQMIEDCENPVVESTEVVSIE